MSEIERPDTVGAHRRAETIRDGMRGYATAMEAIAEAFEARDWMTLGYKSWDEYCEKEFSEKRLKLNREQREQAVLAFRGAGMSTRAIAAALGVDDKTVRNDLAGAEFSAPGSVLGVDGKTYPVKTAADADRRSADGDRGASSHGDIPAPAGDGGSKSERDSPSPVTQDAPVDQDHSMPEQVATADRPELNAPTATRQRSDDTSAHSSLGQSGSNPSAAVRGGAAGDEPEEVVPPASSGAPKPSEDTQFIGKYAKTLAGAHQVLGFDAERVGWLASQRDMEQLQMFADAIGKFYDRARQARSGFRVLKGGAA